MGRIAKKSVASKKLSKMKVKPIFSAYDFKILNKTPQRQIIKLYSIKKKIR